MWNEKSACASVRIFNLFPSRIIATASVLSSFICKMASSTQYAVAHFKQKHQKKKHNAFHPLDILLITQRISDTLVWGKQKADKKDLTH